SGGHLRAVPCPGPHARRVFSARARPGTGPGCRDRRPLRWCGAPRGAADLGGGALLLRRSRSRCARGRRGDASRPPFCKNRGDCAMSLELKILALSILLGLVQILLSAHSASLQVGYRWTAFAKEARPPLTGVAGRLERALRNFLETFPLFA